MKPVLTAAETRALDRASEERGVSVEALMERAGLAVAQVAVRAAGGAYGRRAVVVCGKGNNGGDGLVAARHLARWGMGVSVLLLADPEDLQGPSAVNLVRLRGGTVRLLPHAAARLAREASRSDVAVDALFGSGFRGVAEGAYAEAIEALNASGLPVVAVDIPSGVDGDTGQVGGPAVRARATVSFGAHKLGNVLFPGAAHAGLVEVADIGFPEDLVRSDVLLVEEDDARGLLPRRPADAHKRTSGVVMVAGGSRRMTGAPWLMALGAYRAGAGLVRIAVPEGILPVVQANHAEATFLPLREGPAGSVAASAVDELDLTGFDAMAIGPGLSTEEETPGFVRRVVRGSPVPVVVDADALNAFVDHVGELADRAAEAVLTPHAGEFGRLFGMPSREVLEDPVGLARKAAAETRAVVVLKGPRAIVALPDGDVRINPTGSASLATGGTGDVLSGVIAAMLARGLPAGDAATLGVYLHGLAGVLLAEGAVASDVAAVLPTAAEELAR